MKSKTKKDIKEALIGGAIVLFFIWALTGCTWTFHRSPMELNIPQEPPFVPAVEAVYKYYVIDEHSKIPDAYFETKEEAEKYKTYFKDNHNYVVVQLQ